jgi:TonB family protein
MKRYGLLLGTVILLLVAAGYAQTPVRVSSLEAAKHLTSYVEPVYPPIARTARIQGQVIVDVTISETGSIQNVQLISGHPILASAALDAVRQWRYKPFEVDGKPAVVITAAKVNFSFSDNPEKGRTREQLLMEEYFGQNRACRDYLNANNLQDAESSCSKLADVADQLPEHRFMEKTEAYHLAGQAFFLEKNFDAALLLFQREFDLAKATLQPGDVALAYAWRDMARVQASTGKLVQSDDSYRNAELMLQIAQARVSSESAKNEYSKALKKDLLEHADILRRMGRDAEADAQEQRADAIQIRTGLAPD